MGFWKSRDLVTTRGLPRDAVEELFTEAEEMRAAVSADKVPQCLKRMSVGLLFFEPSLRSNLFLTSAASRLGGSAFNYSQSPGFEVFKGESFSNAVRLASATVDCVAIRHPMAGAAAVAAEASEIPVLNCGDGSNQHPLNALSYLFEVNREKKGIDGLRFVFVGDLACSRTVHSFLYLLAAFENVSIELHSSPQSRIPAWVLNELRDSAKVREATSLDLQNA
ncbi:MAG: aspartate carbamoyltransferase, partial [Candidatus Micrarchaeota archaeon]